MFIRKALLEVVTVKYVANTVITKEAGSLNIITDKLLEVNI